MCGIVGSLGWIPSEHLRAAAGAHHLRRGPDGGDNWLDESRAIWLSHRRLAIQDLSAAGAQPMRHPDHKNIVVTYNGEIYNYVALRELLEARNCRFVSTCDTELLLHAYTTWGTDLFAHIEGMFAFAIWDGRKNRALLARDPVGQKPLYYHSTGNTLRFASTTGALRLLDGGLSRLNPLALCYVLTLGYVPAPHAVWQNVSSLSPGHFLTWTPDSGPQLHCYWSPPDHVDGALDRSYFADLFPQICSEHLIADLPVSLLLSGGLDSTCIARTLSESRTQDVLAVTLDFAGSSETEAPLARDTARQLRLNHQSIQIRTEQIDNLRINAARVSPEPQGYSALLTWFESASAISKSFKVALSGDGGDELFGGYRWYRNLRRPIWEQINFRTAPDRTLSEFASPAERVRALKRFSRRSLLHRHAARVFPRFLPEEAAQLFAPLDAKFDDSAMLAPLEQHFIPALPLQNALQRVDLLTFCSGSILAKTDHMSMAHSLEVRAPFLDRRLINWALSRPAEPTRVGAEKKLIRDYLRGHVPDAVLTHPKQGFSMRNMKQYDYGRLATEIAASRLCTEGLLRSDFARYVAPGVPHRNARLWTLAAVALWYEHQHPSQLEAMRQ